MLMCYTLQNIFAEFAKVVYQYPHQILKVLINFKSLKNIIAYF